MYGRVSEPRMGKYPPRVRRDRGVARRGNSRRARLAPSLAKAGRGGRLGQWDWGSENAGMKVICLLNYIYISIKFLDDWVVGQMLGTMYTHVVLQYTTAYRSHIWVPFTSQSAERS